MTNSIIYIGDSQTISIPLTLVDGSAFTPGSSYNLIFTAKYNPSDADSAAVIQKLTGAGLTVSGSTASVEIVPADTVDLNACGLYCDIQAQHNSTGAVLTVARVSLTLVRDITRETTTSIAVYTTNPPSPAGALPAGGTTGQVLAKESSADGDAGWQSVSGTGDALQAFNLDQFADVAQTSGATLTISSATTLSGGTHSGNNSGDQTTITGNAGSATVLQTARTINGVSFNGSANITVTAAGSTLSDTVPIGKGGTGLTTLGSALQVLRVNAGGTALEYAAAGTGSGTVTSDITGLTGAIEINNVVGITQAGFNLIGTPDANTYYAITDAAPPGGTGTVTSVSVTTANGISGSVATATSTPAITLTLGAITPTSVNSVVISGASTPTLSVTGTSSISGANTGDQTTVSGNAGTVTTINGRLVEGAGTILTGSGTAASPYAVNAVVAASDIRATGTITYTGLPTSGQGITIGIRAYTFQSTGPLAASDILIGTDVDTMIANTVTAINSPATGTANSDVIAEAYSASEVRLIAIVTGTGGNSVALSETASNTAVSGSTLTGGGTLGTAAFTAATAYVPAAGALGTPTSGTLTNCSGLPISTGVSGLGTGIATALAVNTGSAGAPVLLNGALGVPTSGELDACTKVREPWVFILSGPAVTDVATTGRKAWFRVTQACTLAQADVSVDAVTAPTVTTFIADIEKNGTSIYSTRPSIDATEISSSTGTVGTMSTNPTSFAVGDIVGVWVDQIGSAGAGFSLTAGFKF